MTIQQNVNGKVPKNVRASGNKRIAVMLIPIPGAITTINKVRPSIAEINLLGCPPKILWHNNV